MQRLIILSMFLIAIAVPIFAAPQNLPACDTQVLTRRGNRVSISLDALTRKFNQQLHKAHSDFRDLQLTSEGNGDLKVSGQKNGEPMSISGPLRVTSSGKVLLHAKHITKSGSAEKGIMGLFGENLSDYLNLQKTKSMSVHENDLLVNPDSLLGLHGRVKGVHLKNSTVEMLFASQPCR